MSDLTRRTCRRCLQALPEGSGYCVACNCSNDAAHEKLIANENKIENRRFWFKIWTSLGNIGLFSRLFR
jgi:hypothetical protein